MKASDYIAHFLKANGVNTVFGVTGAHILHVFDSLDKAGIRIVACNHEQGAAFAADAYARVSGKVGVCITTSGPGALNAVSGAASAYFDSVPVVFITGQVTTADMRPSARQRQGGFQETDVVSVFGSVVKAGCQIRSAFDLPDAMLRAWTAAIEDRPGSVLLDIPDDVQRGEVSEPPQCVALRCGTENHHDKDVESQLMHLLVNAKRPVIILGAGVRQGRAIECVMGLVQRFNWPVLTTWGGLDLIAADDPQCVGTFGACGPWAGNLAVQNADLILSLGSRLWAHTIGSNPKGFAPDAEKIVVDIDQAELNKLSAMSHLTTIRSDLRTFCESLWYLSFQRPQYADWYSQIATWRAEKPLDTLIPPYDLLSEVSTQAPEDAIVVTDAGATLCWVMQSWRVKAGQRVLSSFNHSPMGWAIPAALGASLAALGKRTICITGDGSLGMNAQELAVIAGLNLPVTVIGLDNGGYGIIRQTQDTWLDGRHIASKDGSGLFTPEAGELCAAYGIETLRMKGTDGLAQMRDWKSEGPFAVIVAVPPEARISPKLGKSKDLLSLEEVKA